MAPVYKLTLHQIQLQPTGSAYTSGNHGASLLEPSPGALKTVSTRPSCPSTVRPLAGRPLLPQHSPLLAAMDKALLWPYKWPLGSTEKGLVLLLSRVEERSNFLKEKERLWFIFCGCWQSREVKKGVTKVSKKGEEERRKKGGGLREFHSFLP